MSSALGQFPGFEIDELMVLLAHAKGKLDILSVHRDSFLFFMSSQVCKNFLFGSSKSRIECFRAKILKTFFPYLRAALPYNM